MKVALCFYGLLGSVKGKSGDTEKSSSDVLDIAFNHVKIHILYLNDIYLGFRSYGIASASLNYFNKSLSDLNLNEIAFLASLPKAPNNYNPKINYKTGIKKFLKWYLNYYEINKK